MAPDALSLSKGESAFVELAPPWRDEGRQQEVGKADLDTKAAKTAKAVKAVNGW
jgi:hypothetical protein